MEWFVYNYNINKHEIEAFNIFKHGGFAKYFGKLIRTIKDKVHIKRQQHANEAKIDIYNQVMFRFYEFVNYCWSFKR